MIFACKNHRQNEQQMVARSVDVIPAVRGCEKFVLSMIAISKIIDKASSKEADPKVKMGQPLFRGLNKKSYF